jgi:hypothetical protein
MNDQTVQWYEQNRKELKAAAARLNAEKAKDPKHAGKTK